MSFAPIAAFEAANLVAGERFYDLRILSETGGPLTNSLGWGMNTEELGEGRFDTLMVGSGPDLVSPSPRTVAYLREAVSTTRRVASICIAAFTLAEAGILDGRRATTHWSYAEELGKRFPKITVEMDRIFIADGPVWTSAGMTAGIDLALGLIERDLGQQAAQRTARVLVIHHRRAGGQSQHSAMLQLDAKSDRVQIALAFAKQNLREQLTVELLADAARLSPRQFSRVFRARPAFHRRKQLRTCASRPPGSCLSKAGCRSRKLLAKRDSAIASECGGASIVPSAPHPRPFATQRIHWRPSNRFGGRVCRCIRRLLHLRVAQKATSGLTQCHKMGRRSIDHLADRPSSEGFVGRSDKVPNFSRSRLSHLGSRRRSQ
jgi:transcriptional regulator GlxA family with amidase domain